MRRLERVVSLHSNSPSFCVRFRPKINDDKYFISIKSGSRCTSYVSNNLLSKIIENFILGWTYFGRWSNSYTLHIDTYCVDSEATIMHEFMHSKNSIFIYC
jgi:hypothetical protein